MLFTMATSRLFRIGLSLYAEQNINLFLYIFDNMNSLNPVHTKIIVQSS